MEGSQRKRDPDLPELVYQIKDLILFEFGVFLTQFEGLHLAKCICNKYIEVE